MAACRRPVSLNGNPRHTVKLLHIPLLFAKTGGKRKLEGSSLEGSKATWAEFCTFLFDSLLLFQSAWRHPAKKVYS